MASSTLRGKLHEFMTNFIGAVMVYTFYILKIPSACRSLGLKLETAMIVFKPNDFMTSHVRL